MLETIPQNFWQHLTFPRDIGRVSFRNRNLLLLAHDACFKLWCRSTIEQVIEIKLWSLILQRSKVHKYRWIIYTISSRDCFKKSIMLALIRRWFSQTINPIFYKVKRISYGSLVTKINETDKCKLYSNQLRILYPSLIWESMLSTILTELWIFYHKHANVFLR